MTVPLYLNTQFPGSHLVIDTEGLPVYQKDTFASFTVSHINNDYVTYIDIQSYR